MQRLTNFLKEVTARLKGDENGVIAAKNERKANSAIQGQLAALRAKQVDDESHVEDMEEAYKNALYPTTLISHNSTYVNNVANAQMNLEAAKSTLESTKKTIEFFQGILDKEFSAS